LYKKLLTEEKKSKANFNDLCLKLNYVLIVNP